MQIHFKSLSKPKDTAKKLASLSGRDLSFCQASFAKAFGYQDWFSLQKSIPATTPTVNISLDDLADIIVSLSVFLNTNAGDIQHALRYFLPNSPDGFFKQALALRIKIFERMEIKPGNGKNVGQVVKIKGRKGLSSRAIISGQNIQDLESLMLINDDVTRFMAIRSDFIIPRQKNNLFIPMNLYFPYGEWEEEDGSRVIFSREYFPMWRIRPNSAPERVNPWEWIKFKAERLFWPNSTWHDDATYYKSIALLEKNGIRSMPILTEALPSFIHGDYRSYRDAGGLLKAIRP